MNEMNRWGIIGCGRIAGRMAELLTDMPDVRITAAAARDISRAAAFAEKWGIPKAYGSYAELAADPEVDMVYAATIHPTHKEAVQQCLLAGKAVLCEKPMTMTAQEARELFSLAEGKKILLMEAMWTRFLPVWREVRERVNRGDIGAVRYMRADFSDFMPFEPDSRIYDPAKGGGALLDIGVYALQMILYILGKDCRLLSVSGHRAPTGVDDFAAVLLESAEGIAATATCASGLAGDKKACIYGVNGWIEIPQMMGASTYTLHLNGQRPQEIVCPYDYGFRGEVEEFHRLYKEGRIHSEIHSPEDTIRGMELIEQAMAAIH